MQAYDYRCSVCGLKLYHQARPFPMEAAHIKWKARGGACEVQNGLSLCPTHHNTFDKGIWTLDMDYQVEISEAVQLDVAADVFFLPFKGKKVTEGLMNPKLTPNRENFSLTPAKLRTLFM